MLKFCSIGSGFGSKSDEIFSALQISIVICGDIRNKIYRRILADFSFSYCNHFKLL